MPKLRKGDIIQVTKGKDKGKKGKILKFIPETNRALVEGINTVKKHKRQSRQDEKGGIVSIEMPISIANIMFYCKSCDKPARLGYLITQGGNKSRICKICKEAV